jgi:hypothetical protein
MSMIDGRFRVYGILLALLLFGELPAPAAEQRHEYDVVVVGAGTGGVAAAIQAARMGARVALVEESGWIGGQMTAAGVPTMDDLSGNLSGLYGEFVERVRYHYFKKDKSIATCYWSGNSIAFEPSVGHRILKEMIGDLRRTPLAGGALPVLDIFLRARFRDVLGRDGAVSGVLVESAGNGVELSSRVVVDATEYGDVLAKAGARYRIGRTTSDAKDETARIQDITYVAIAKKYPGGVPPRMRVSVPPAGYEESRKEFRKYVIRQGNGFRGEYPIRLPVVFSAHNAYRGLPDSSNRENYDASSPEAWLHITKTCVNWANDFPGMSDPEGGLPIRYIEDPDFRRKVDTAALLKTIHFLYYISDELQEWQWGLADDEYGEPGDAPATVNLTDIPREYHDLLRFFPPRPYVREGRRIEGILTLTAKELRSNSESYRDGRGNRELPTALAVGGYILDLHNADRDRDLEAEFGERNATIRECNPVGPFQIPFEVFIPERVDGLVAAEKNLSVSRLAEGAIRLQPVTMLTGQAAGAIAAVAVRRGAQPRNVNPAAVQLELLRSGSALSLCAYRDVPPGHPFWPAVSLATVRRLMDPVRVPSSPAVKINDPYNCRVQANKLAGDDKGEFGVDLPVTGTEVLSLMERVFGEEGRLAGAVLPADSATPVTRATFATALGLVLKAKATAPDLVFPDVAETDRLFVTLSALARTGVLGAIPAGGPFEPARPVTRGFAADVLVRAMASR